MDQVTVGNVDIFAQFYGLSLQHSSYNESQSNDSLRPINRISSWPWFHQRNAKRFHIVHPAPVSTNDIVTTARNELDTWADTIYYRNNFRTIVLTGQTCEVKGFHDSLEAIKNLPVGKMRRIGLIHEPVLLISWYITSPLLLEMIWITCWLIQISQDLFEYWSGEIHGAGNHPPVITCPVITS